jgi:hypothetical protein
MRRTWTTAPRCERTRIRTTWTATCSVTRATPARRTRWETTPIDRTHCRDGQLPRGRESRARSDARRSTAKATRGDPCPHDAQNDADWRRTNCAGRGQLPRGRERRPAPDGDGDQIRRCVRPVPGRTRRTGSQPATGVCGAADTLPERVANPALGRRRKTPRARTARRRLRHTAPRSRESGSGRPTPTGDAHGDACDVCPLDAADGRRTPTGSLCERRQLPDRLAIPLQAGSRSRRQIGDAVDPDRVGDLVPAPRTAPHRRAERPRSPSEVPRPSAFRRRQGRTVRWNGATQECPRSMRYLDGSLVSGGFA